MKPANPEELKVILQQVGLTNIDVGQTSQGDASPRMFGSGRVIMPATPKNAAANLRQRLNALGANFRINIRLAQVFVIVWLGDVFQLPVDMKPNQVNQIVESLLSKPHNLDESSTNDVVRTFFWEAKQQGLAGDFEWDPHHGAGDSPSVVFTTPNPRGLLALFKKLVGDWDHTIDDSMVTFYPPNPEHAWEFDGASGQLSHPGGFLTSWFYWDDANNKWSVQDLAEDPPKEVIDWVMSLDGERKTSTFTPPVKRQPRKAFNIPAHLEAR